MTTRHLAAILAADVVGFSSLMEEDEEGTLARIKQLRREVIEPKVKDHNGRVFKTTGDGLLVEFSSPVEAVQCAVVVQEALASQAPQDLSQALQLRIGINLGDIIIEEDGDLYGDGVNIAARLEQLADPGGIAISGKVYEEVRDKLPYAFEDRGEQQVKNIARPVRVYALRGLKPAVTPKEPKELPLPDRPSIAVLPFTNMSSDPEQEYVADGMAEEIIAALSRIRTLFVIARNSSFSYKGTTKDVRQVARDLGVRYVLVGSVRKAGRRLRLTAELVDGSDGGHIWADRYDSEVEDIFDLQDRLTEAIIGAILPNIRTTEIERARRKRPESLNAYDCVMRAMPAVWAHDPELAVQALELLERAMSLDPNYALAKSFASWCHAQQVIYLRSSNPQREREQALALAEAAAQLDSNDPLVLTALAAAYTLVKRLDRALVLIDKALRLDPNSAWAWQRSGWVRVHEGPAELAIAHFERGLRISPFDPINFNSYLGIGVAHFTAERYEQAVHWLRKGIEERPSAVWAHRLLAPAYALAGQVEEARRSAAQLLHAHPDYSITNDQGNFVVNPRFRDHFIKGLRMAGVPE